MQDIVRRAVTELRTDRTHGSRWLARRAVEALEAFAASFPAGADAEVLLRDAARDLAEARPSMAVIRNAVGWVYAEALELAARDAPLPDAVRDRAATWLRRWDWTVEELARYAEGLLRGPVATISFSHTVLRVLISRRSRLSRVLVAESRPGLEGRSTAAELAAAGIPVTLATDAALPSLIQDGTVVVFGVDAILATGAVVNKAGTFPLAAAAVRNGARCYALAETFKITDRPFIPEEADPRDIVDPLPEGVEVRNPLFDRTPPDLIEGYVTEDGVLTASSLDRYVERARRASEGLGFAPGY